MAYSVNGITPASGLHREYLENYNEKRHGIGMKGEEEKEGALGNKRRSLMG